MILTGIIILIAIIVIAEYLDILILKVILLSIGISYIFYIFAITDIFNGNFSRMFMALSVVSLFCAPIGIVVIYVQKLLGINNNNNGDE